jgi:fatty-acyl-CoA synthase
MLVNLPPSHVGCQTEQLMTPIYAGETSVIMHIFDAEKTLDAIQKHKITIFGQIPALFAMQWRLPNYDRYDLSSLRFAIYGGQAVDKPFLEKLRTMAPLMGTGLGLTETAGFCTYTPTDWKVEEIVDSIGFDSPLCPISIREPMKADGSAGAEKKAGDIGEICFEGPQVFLGYMNDEANTRKTVTTDGVCYTGDIGFYNDTGLHFAGRSKFVIKPKGYQVFPAEVENFITDSFKDRVVRTGCVGVKHDVFTEAIVACVEIKQGTSLTREELDAKMKEVAAYKRPSHYIFLEEGKMPLNRVAKVDVLELKKMADVEIDGLRRQGKWDKA